MDLARRKKTKKRKADENISTGNPESKTAKHPASPIPPKMSQSPSSLSNQANAIERKTQVSQTSSASDISFDMYKSTLIAAEALSDLASPLSSRRATINTGADLLAHASSSHHLQNKHLSIAVSDSGSNPASPNTLSSSGSISQMQMLQPPLYQKTSTFTKPQTQGNYHSNIADPSPTAKKQKLDKCDSMLNDAGLLLTLWK